MTLRKAAAKQWPDDKVIEYLESQYPNEKVKWVILLDEGLYGFVASDGTQFASADDDEIRNAGIIEFLKRNGGEYVSN